MTSSEQRAMKEQHGLTNEHAAADADIQSQRSPHFGNYDLVRRIDVGGMGEVYLARQRTAFGRQVALKIIRPDLMHDVTTRKRFLREAEVSAHLKHDHILPLVEFGEEQGRLFLVTPYVEGGTLGQRLQRGPLSLSDIHQLFPALVQAVAYIHKRGVIHRDLKPSNILLEQNGEQSQTYVRLIDFGIASIQGTTVASAPLTSAGHEMGTVAYMAPERLSGIAAPSNDIYSLGIILYQMLTGQLPNNGQAVALPQALDSIIKRSTATDPNQRYATAEDLLKAFEYAYRFLNVHTAQKGQSGLIKAVTIEDEAEEDNQPTPKSLPSSRSLASAQEYSESMILRRNEGNGPAKTTTVFQGNDYSAPTSYIGPAKVTVGDTARPGTPPRPRRKRKASVVVALTIAILAVLVALTGIGLLTFQAAISATVTVTPQTHVINNVLTVTARIGQRNIDVANSTVPATVLSSIQTTQNSGSTTGHGNCVFGIFDCKQVVDQADVDNLTQQDTPTLQNQIIQDLHSKAQASGLTIVGSIHYGDPNSVANPPVGAESKTVTVSVTEQGYLEAIKTSDVTSLARQALTRQKDQQFGAKYILLNQFTQIGQPAIQSVDAQGNVIIQIAVGGVVKYQFSATDLNTLQTDLKGMKLQEARLFLSKQAGIDPKSVSVHLSYGDTMPTNIQQIKLFATDPTNIPSVQLPTVKSTATPNQ